MFNFRDIDDYWVNCSVILLWGIILYYHRRHKNVVMLLDNCVKTAYCYQRISDQASVNQIELINLKKRFDVMIGLVEQELPGMEEDYEQLENFFSILEYIGLGQLLKDLNKLESSKITACFYVW